MHFQHLKDLNPETFTLKSCPPPQHSRIQVLFVRYGMPEVQSESSLDSRQKVQVWVFGLTRVWESVLCRFVLADLAPHASACAAHEPDAAHLAVKYNGPFRGGSRGSGCAAEQPQKALHPAARAPGPGQARLPSSGSVRNASKCEASE